MNKFTKAMAAIMLIVAAIVVAGCQKNDDNDVKVTTYTPQDITATTVKCGGDVVVTQGLTISELGVCWSVEKNPTANDHHLSTTNWGESFVCTIIGLEPNTRYHIRAYALRGLEYYYGEDKSFTTLEGGGNTNEGALSGLFSVSETQKVCFSKGNLQYQASTNTWRFAENQWDFVGTQESVWNNGGTVIGSDNSLVSSSYSGWIDLFGWGTSGYSHGAICYQPWTISNIDADYYAYGQYAYNLYDQTGQADWGYNPISNGGNSIGQWRTLLRAEWVYVLNSRTTASGILFAKACINDVNGIVLFPDDWAANTINLNNVNQYDADFSSNELSVTQWNTLETKGAVFLPAAGYRTGDYVMEVGVSGFYWSSSFFDGKYSYYLYFEEDYCSGSRAWSRCNGQSVRLVCNAH